MIDAAGNATSRMRYHPYGQAWTQSAPPATDKLFTGHTRLGARSGMYYAGARFYSADLGRFMSADSIVPGAGDPQALNRYAYVRGNPLRFSDPTGHRLMDDSGPDGSNGTTCMTTGCGSHPLPPTPTLTPVPTAICYVLLQCGPATPTPQPTPGLFEFLGSASSSQILTPSGWKVGGGGTRSSGITDAGAAYYVEGETYRVTLRVNLFRRRQSSGSNIYRVDALVFVGERGDPLDPLEYITSVETSPLEPTILGGNDGNHNDTIVSQGLEGAPSGKHSYFFDVPEYITTDLPPENCTT